LKSKLTPTVVEKRFN